MRSIVTWSTQGISAMMHPTAVMVLHSMSTIAAGSQSGFFQAVEGVGAYCGALAGGEYQNYTSQRLTLQLVVSLQHQPAFGNDPTEEGDAHLGHQGLTLTDARVNRATSQPYPLTFLHPFVFSFHITGFRNLRLNASATTSSKDR